MRVRLVLRLGGRGRVWTLLGEDVEAEVREESRRLYCWGRAIGYENENGGRGRGGGWDACGRIL